MTEERVVTQEKAEAMEQANGNNQAGNTEQEVPMENAKAITSAGKDEAATDMQVTSIDINSIVVKYHPRKNPGEIDPLRASIKRDGLQEALLVYQAGEDEYAVIDGTRRLQALREFGWPTIPCIIKKDVEPSEAAHLSYVKNSERSAFDPIEVALHIKAMKEDFGYSLRDLELKGYGSTTRIANKMKLLYLPEPVQKQIQKGKLTAAHGLAILKLGSAKEQERMAKRIVDHEFSVKRAERQIKKYLAKGKDKKPRVQVPATDIPGVYIKDSRDMSELADKTVHLIVSSPPYNVGMEYEKGVPFKEHVERVKEVLEECKRVLVPGGIMALNVGDIHCFRGPTGNSDQVQIQLIGHIYQNFLRRHEIYLTDLIIWRKPSPWKKKSNVFFTDEMSHTSYRIANNFEPVYIFRKTGEREEPSAEVVLASKLTKEQWIAWAPSVWEIEPVRDQTEHPAVYPDELCYRLIKMFSYEGDTVLDPWLGSGTTVKVARELNREGIGYEIEPQYKPVIMKKLGIEPEKPAAEFFTNLSPKEVEKIQADIRVPEVESQSPPSQDQSGEVGTEQAVASAAQDRAESVSSESS